MPIGGAELFALGFLDNQIATQLGEVPLLGTVTVTIPDLAIATSSAFDATGATTILPVGPAGAATFVIELESGATVTYEWDTEVDKAWSGIEQRVQWSGAPRQTYDFTTIVRDADLRVILSALVANSAQAQPFLVGLAFEELTISADATSTVVSVVSTAKSDWVLPGQRAVVVSKDGATVINCVVQSSTSSTITVDVNVSAAAKAGARIMPAMAVYIDPQQDFRRYPVNAGPWALKARAALFGFGGVTTMGVGATVNTYAGMPLWDRGLAMQDTLAQPLDTGAELVDLGGVPDNIAAWTVADWGRTLKIESPALDDFQWLKAFAAAIRGGQVVFLAPTGRPDLVPIGDASTGTLKVSSDAKYATTWFTSLAHRRLQFTMADGTIVYRTVNTAVDNGDGTQSLGLDSAAAGTIAMVSFLETCRLEGKQVPVVCDGANKSSELVARVVQYTADAQPSTFDGDSRSVQDARPAILFTIVTPTTTYRLTNYDEDVVFGGNTYSKATIDKEHSETGQVGQGRDATITISIDHALAQDLLVGGIPQRDVTVTVQKLMQRSGAARGLWFGHVADLTTDGNVVKLRVPELVDDYVSCKLPVIVAQRVCQHGLGDTGCTIDLTLAAFQVTTTVSAISVDGLTITIASIGGHPDNWAQYGRFTRSTDGEPRSIMSHVGTAIVIDTPFRTLNVGDAVTLTIGCDHTPTTCRDKFSNMVNYGGLPQMTWNNPFSPLRLLGKAG